MKLRHCSSKIIKIPKVCSKLCGRLDKFGFNRIDNLAVVNRIFKTIGLLSEIVFAFYSVLKEGEDCR